MRIKIFYSSVTGFSYSVVALLRLGTDSAEIFKKALDIITISVPPALPTCITVGISFSIVRFHLLKKINKKALFLQVKLNVLNNID
jgi:cation-transporting P-type ATPase 13A2